MKKRGTISRCCCGGNAGGDGGGGGGAGVCVDACLSNWNSCPVTANGDLTLAQLDPSLGWNGCTWWTDSDNPPAGSDGNFSSTSNPFFNIRSGASKGFSFDYRTVNTLEMQSDVEVVKGGPGGSFWADVPIRILDSIILLATEQPTGSGATIPARIVSTGGYSQDTDLTSATLKIVATMGEVQATRVGNYNYWDGTGQVFTTGCIDSLNVTYESYVNGVIVSTYVRPSEFFGGRCYTFAGIGLTAFGRFGIFGGVPATASTSATTITAT